MEPAVRGDVRPPTELPRATSTPKPVALGDRTAWRDGALAWLAQHVLYLVVAYLAVTLLRPNAATATAPISWSALFSPLTGWDAAFYAHIARQGYTSWDLAAYYPLFAVVERVAAPLFGGSALVAGVVLANVCELGTFGLVRVLAERELGRAAAQRTLLYLALFPSAFFLAAAYPESLFLLLTVGVFLAFRSNHWVLAGVLAALATLARPFGVLLAIPLLVALVLQVRGGQIERRVRGFVAPVVAIISPFVALLAYWVFLYRQFGTIVVITQSEQFNYWKREVTWPWVGLARAANAVLVRGLLPSYFQAHALLDIGFTLVLIGLTIVGTRRVSAPYAAYAWVVTAFILITPSHNWYALGSNMRFMLADLPLFLVLGRLGERPAYDRAILVLSGALFALLAAIFVLGGWVA